MTVDTAAVVRALHTSSEPLTASAIALRLRTQRQVVNALLYAGLGSSFRKTLDEKPRWSLMDSGFGALNISGFDLNTSPSGPIHVDQQGGDWLVTVAIQQRSRNDPPYIVELTGVREATILVNGSLLGVHVEDNWHSAYLIAAFALTHQILLHKFGEVLNDAVPETILRDSLLAFGIARQTDRLSQGDSHDSSR